MDELKVEGKEEAKIRVGTSAFTADGWVGSFYPKGMQPRDFLSFYATKFDTVEVDSTYYRTPRRGVGTRRLRLVLFLR